MKPIDCQRARELMMRQVDGVITPEEQTALEAHLRQCPRCQQDFTDIQHTKEVTNAMKKELLPDMAWDEYWQHLYNRLERGIAWILISVGLIIILGYAAVDFLREVVFNPQMGLLERIGITSLVVGSIVLLISVIREKLMTRKVDKYREIQR